MPPKSKKLKTIPEGLDGLLLEPLPTFDPQELYNPVIVAIKIPIAGGGFKSFRFVREVLCTQSAYFRSAFKGEFAEAIEKSITLTDVKPATLACYITWLHTHRLRVMCDDMPAGHDPDEPTTYSWSLLFDLYVFGDKYDTKGFRDLVFETIQTKILQAKPNKFEFPDAVDMEKIYSNTPESSKLRQFLVLAKIPSFEKDRKGGFGDVRQMPRDFAVDLLTQALRRTQALACRHCRPKGDHKRCDVGHTLRDVVLVDKREWCEFHEHGTEEEKRLCGWRREAMDWRFQKG